MYDNFITFSIVFISICSIVLGVYSIIPTLLCFCGVTLLLCLLLHALDFFYFAYLFLIIYVGAIAILFTYVIMLLNLHNIDVYTRSRINFHVVFLAFLFGIFLYSFFLMLHTTNSLSLPTTLSTNNRFIFDDVFTIYIFGGLGKNVNLGIVSDLQQIGYILFYAFQIHIIICTLLLLVALFGVLVLSSNSQTHLQNKFVISTKAITLFHF